MPPRPCLSEEEWRAKITLQVFALSLQRLQEPACVEFTRCQMTPLSEAHLAMLAEVPADSLALVAPATIRVEGDWFEFDHYGAEAFVIPAHYTNLGLYWAIQNCGIGAGLACDLATETRDLVAFHPSTPGRWALRYGRHDCLGHLGDPEEPARVWRTPLAWLRAGCDGICPLTREGVWSSLMGHGHFIAEDRAHAAELRRICAQPFLTPRIDAA